jgi:GT2 family glycosyltransferase
MSDDKTPSATSGKLNWTLAICTYNRPHFLTETLGFALAQSRLPTEIVVVDASDAWADHRDLVQERFIDHWAEVRLIYEPAKVRSLTFQRNQALDLATSDVVFSLDDDIYLYPDAAEKIMQIYEADPEERVVMVAGHFTEGAYDPDAGTDAAETSVSTPAGPVSIKGKMRQWLESQLTLDGHFVPYGSVVDRGPLPKPVQDIGASAGGLINGGRTTFRRAVGSQVGWSELLRYYATHEDSDLSYRMSRHGRLAHAQKAGFFHADGNESNVGRFRINTIRVRNLMALHAIHSDNRLRSAWRLSASFLKFAALYLLIDPAQGRFSFPTARAYAYGLLQVPIFLFWPFADFEAWYTGLQEKMYGNRYKS